MGYAAIRGRTTHFCELFSPGTSPDSQLEDLRKIPWGLWQGKRKSNQQETLPESSQSQRPTLQRKDFVKGQYCNIILAWGREFQLSSAFLFHLRKNKNNHSQQGTRLGGNRLQLLQSEKGVWEQYQNISRGRKRK